MSNAITTTSTSTIGEVSPLTWETKTGKARAAHSATAQALAPRAVRLDSAIDADVTRLMSGRYSAFMADVRAELKGKTLDWFTGTVRQSLTVTHEGVPMAPVGDVLTMSNKVGMRAFCNALIVLAAGNAATMNSKGDIKVLKCPAKCAHFACVARVWFDAMEVVEAEKLARLEADRLPA